MRHSAHAQTKSRRGFTLNEIAIVLGVASIITSGIWVVYGTMRNSNRVKQAAQQVLTIAQNVKISSAEVGYTEGNELALTRAMDRLQAFPANMRRGANVPDGAVFHPWNMQATLLGLGNVTVGSTNAAGNTVAGRNGRFSVKFYNVPRDACVALFTRTNGNHMAGLQSVRASGCNGAPTPVPMTLPLINGCCGAGAMTNEMQWIFTIKDTQ
jgi:hypothetical protein